MERKRKWSFLPVILTLRKQTLNQNNPIED